MRRRHDLQLLTAYTLYAGGARDLLDLLQSDACAGIPPAAWAAAPAAAPLDLSPAPSPQQTSTAAADVATAAIQPAPGEAAPAAGAAGSAAAGVVDIPGVKARLAAYRHRAVAATLVARRLAPSGDLAAALDEQLGMQHLEQVRGFLRSRLS